MTLKGESLRELMQLQRKINVMFEEMLQPQGTASPLPAYTWAPIADVYEDEKHYFVEMEIPGVTIDEISVTCESNVLTIQGERKPERTRSRENVQRVERYFGPFLRELAFPAPVDASKIKASLGGGLLSLTLPKKEHKRRIHVR